MAESSSRQGGRATRARIIAAAAELMHKRGVAATSVDDVLAAAGAGKGQMYHYFTSKEDLVEAVLQHQLARVLAEQASFDLQTWKGIRGWLDSLVEMLIERNFYGGCPLGAIIAEVADANERLRTVAAEAFARWEAELTRELDGLVSTGRLRASTDTRALSEAALATIQGGYLLSTTRRDAGPMRRAVDAAYQMLRSHAR